MRGERKESTIEDSPFLRASLFQLLHKLSQSAWSAREPWTWPLLGTHANQVRSGSSSTYSMEKYKSEWGLGGHLSQDRRGDGPALTTGGHLMSVLLLYRRRCQTCGKACRWGSTCLSWATPTPAWPSGKSDRCAACEERAPEAPGGHSELPRSGHRRPVELQDHS